MLETARLALGDAGLVLSLIVTLAAALAVLRRGYLKWTAHRHTVLERRRRIDGLLGLADMVEQLLKQLSPEHGPTLLDKVNGISLEIHRISRRLDLALAQSDMAQAWTSHNGDWVEISRAMQRQVGRGADELIGRGWYDAIDELERGEVIRRFEEAVRDHREFEYVFSWHRPDGTYVLVRMAAWWVQQAHGYVVNCRKLDQKRWAEEQENAARARRRRNDNDAEGRDDGS